MDGRSWRGIGVVIFGFIYMIYLGFRYLILVIKQRKYLSADGKVTNVIDSDRKGKKTVTVTFEVPSGNSYTITYDIAKKFEPVINQLAEVYYNEENPYEAFTYVQKKAIQSEITILIPLIIVLCFIVAIDLYPSLPKDVSNTMPSEVNVFINPYPESRIQYVKTRTLVGSSTDTLSTKGNDKPYYSLDNKKESLVLADGRKVEVDHYWGKRRILVVGKGYSNRYYKETYYFVTLPLEESENVIMAIFIKTGDYEIADINERIEDAFSQENME